VRCSGNADTSWDSEPLKAGRYVHPVAEQITATDNHVTDVNPDPELQVAFLESVLAGLREGVLDIYSTLNSIHRAWELGQNTIARRIRDPTAIFGNQPVCDLTVGP
jgi:hypothetical protein